MKKGSIYLNLSKEVLNLPLPSSISYFWNFGSLLGMCLVIQIISGLFLSMHFEASSLNSFSSVVMIMNDVNGGWVIRFIHANGASMFFVMVYIHIGRGLYYGSYSLIKPWVIGVTILLMLMGTAFLGYVLPWGQMSYWGATVITNLLSAIPYFGDSLVYWIWGGFSVENPTLVRMFSIHFILPFIILVMVMGHIMALHSSGSSNPLGLGLDRDKIPFHPYFYVKDLLGVVVFISILMTIVFVSPDLFMDPENFIPANPLSTPAHIQPEWYFLFAYSILRSIPSKLGGVVALVLSIAILYLMPLYKKKSGMFSVPLKWLTWFQVENFLVLTWLGGMPVEYPFVQLSRVMTILYFSTFLVWGSLSNFLSNKSK